MVSKVALLQRTQLEIIATSSQYLHGRMVMQDKGAHLKAQMLQGSEIDNVNKISLEVRNSTVVGFI